VHRGQVFGRCEDSTGIEPFCRLVAQVMEHEPYTSADRLFWIVDNGSSRRGQAAIDRLADQYPNAVMVHRLRGRPWVVSTTAAGEIDLLGCPPPASGGATGWPAASAFGSSIRLAAPSRFISCIIAWHT